MDVDQEDIKHVVRDKYAGDESKVTQEDRQRLASGEPLAYVIGWLPFLGLTIDLSSRPLIPRPETEWWTELLVEHIGDRPLNVLDLCAGSGAIGLAILARCPNALVSFGELDAAHAALIAANIERNGLDATRATVGAGDLFAPFQDEVFDLIAVNPPYIPSARTLDENVLAFEPHSALFSGSDGLDIIRRIAEEAPKHLAEGGELWLEADIGNIEAAAGLLEEGGASLLVIKEDLYDRDRLVLAYY